MLLNIYHKLNFQIKTLYNIHFFAHTLYTLYTRLIIIAKHVLTV